MSTPDQHPAIAWVVERLAREPWVERVILYGSRARGTARPWSDIDIAVVGRPPGTSDWSQLSLDVEDDAPTLLDIDLVLLDQIDAAIRDRVLREGKVLHERR